jgi:hypothetical protein
VRSCGVVLGRRWGSGGQRGVGRLVGVEEAGARAWTTWGRAGGSAVLGQSGGVRGVGWMARGQSVGRAGRGVRACTIMSG